MTLHFDAVYKEHAAYVVRSLRRLGVPERDVLDEAQNVFVAVHRKLRDFDPDRPLRPWIFGFCHRVAANYRRLARNRHESMAPGPTEAKSSGDAVQRSEARGIVLLGLQALDDRGRAIFCMYELDGFTAPEIARVLEIEVEDVYVSVKTARRRFRRALAERGLP
ncbi:MAG: sigma-70 family RNA polymerase sigma factor [Myxococcota bacterium]